MANEENTLSVFADESGSFDSNISPSRFYVVSLVFHDQTISIAKELADLETTLSYMGYSNLCLHSGPLIRREEKFENMDIQERRKLFGRLVAFARRAPVQGRSFCIDKRYAGSAELMARAILCLISEHLASCRDSLSRFEKIKVYYDNGQAQVKHVLQKAFTPFPAEFPSNVRPERYRLFQVADLVCTIKLLAEKLDLGIPLTKSERYFFHSVHDLKKDFLRPLSRFLK